MEQGDPLEVELIVTDVDGKAVADRPVKARAVRLAWEFVDGSWQESRRTSRAVTSPRRANRLSAGLKQGRAADPNSAEVRDDQERLNRSELALGERQSVPQRNVQMETAVSSPQGNVTRRAIPPRCWCSRRLRRPRLLTLSHDGIISTTQFSLDGNTATLEIRIEESYLPNVHVQVDLVGSAQRLDDKGNAVERAWYRGRRMRAGGWTSTCRR